MVSLQEARQILKDREDYLKSLDTNAPSRSIYYQSHPQEYQQIKSQTKVNQQYQQQGLKDLQSEKKKLQQYEKELNDYNKQMQEYQEWETAKQLILEGREVYFRSNPSLWSKIRELQRSDLSSFKLPKKPKPKYGEFIDPETGLGYSIDPKLLENEMSIDPSLIKENNKNPFGDFINKPPVLDVRPVPSLKDQYLSKVKKQGPIRGTFDFFFFDKPSEYIDKFEQKEISRNKGSGRYYGSATIQDIGPGVTRAAPYINPAGGYILMAEGFESFFTPGGKERRTQYKEYLTEGNVFGYQFSEKSAKKLSYGPDVGEIMLGYFTSPAYPKTKGYIRSFGREKIPVEKLIPPEVLSGQKTFPELPRSKQLKSFKDSPYRLPGEPAGAYHSTPEQFWDDVITPKPGDSELKGLYGGYSISPYFTGIKNEAKVFDYFFGEAPTKVKPGVAYLEPKGFREVGFKKITGKPSKPLGYEFDVPAMPGYADVPRMKTEAEAIFRPDAGDYVLKNKKFYFKYKGQRVPIDAFEYAAEYFDTTVTKSGKKSRLSSRSGSYGGVPGSSSKAYKNFADAFFGSSIKSNISEIDIYYEFDQISYSPGKKSSKKRSSKKNNSSSYNPFSDESGSPYDPYDPFSGLSGSPSSPRAPSYSPGPYSPPPDTPPGKKILLPPFPFFGNEPTQKKSKRSSRSRKYEYAPSVTALIFGYATTDTKITKKRSFSGFEVRPLILPKIKKRRKKR